MKTAFLFPGQATDIGDAVVEWRRASPRVEQLLQCASDAIGSSIVELTRPSALARTSVFQPVLTAMTIGIFREAAADIKPDLVAGHSVGELAACAAAGAMSGENAVRVAARRGELMEREATRYGGGMIAVRGRVSDVEAALRTGSMHGHVSLAAQNAATEWILSGDVAALRAIEGMMNATPLDTPGPWHSAAMADAIEPYRQDLRRVMRGVMSTPLVCNRTGDVVDDALELVDLLAGQLTSPVLWARSQRTLMVQGITHVVICGPGKSLRRFVRAENPHAEISVVAHPAALSSAP